MTKGIWVVHPDALFFIYFSIISAKAIICAYFGITPADFFAPLAATDTPLAQLIKRLQTWSDEDIAKMIALADMIEK